MARTSSFACVSSGALPFTAGPCRRTDLDSPRNNAAGPPDGRSRHRIPANRKRRLVEHAQMRRLPSRADAALGAERSRTAGVRDRQEIPGGYDRVLAGQQGQVDGLEDLSQSGRSTRPAPAGSRAEHGAPVPGRRRTVVALAERGTKTKPEADRGGNRQEAATRRFVGVLCHSQATADQRKPDHRRRLDHHGARRGKRDPTRRNRSARRCRKRSPGSTPPSPPTSIKTRS